MDREKFEELVRQGIEAIPKKFLEKMNNVDIVVEDEPTEGQIEKLKLRKDAKLFGLYEGIPQTKRGFYAGVLPDKITIFQKPIEETCFNDEQIKEIVKKTVWHEIAHHFGMDEERVRSAEKRRSNN
ncbi:metallopeptidase family protein [Patescibacteria group bacterium]|nr:metallopeptidase family protein [Patescibacteria group bacterium]MBU4458817.1 metallopeptidase family protein [Patescibacteria group bacterium]MCG2696218.1 metallopeptidase family protein [Candidatus Portnoybacteria bacterium]